MYESMMNVSGSSLLGQFERLRRELDDVFGGSGLASGIRSVASGSFPAINIGTTSKSVEIYAFAAGLDPEQIELTLDRGVLTLSGERRSNLSEQPDREPVNVYSRERAEGRFKRVVNLPDDIDPNEVSAAYQDGVLKVSIARKGAPQPQRIAIQ